MTSSYSTGQVAQALGVSEKAVRLYAARGLVPVAQDPRTGRRAFSPEALDRARSVGLLRGVGLPLADIARVLDAADPVAAFDDLWGARRERLRALTAAGERGRAALSSAPLRDVRVGHRDVPERLTLDLELRTDLPGLPDAIATGTATLFDVLRGAGADLSGHPFVAYHGRATGSGTARVTVRVPVADLVRPSGPTRLSVDPAHREEFVPVEDAHARDQAYLVRLHDHLSSGASRGGGPAAGDNREIYLPTFGTGVAGPVMEVAVPVGAPG
ncbi:MerR family transcriptional regulator [Cellulomonas sp. ACRRI]|uniref:MerR family transcriptional regulator n=1 Tax=Cellulomonas sp. ACRRI TaxID=2918188 RepID=UPI001EF23B13|nr:MerR family transcriptional regulator [Cellulomonas sp. ACRRI]MCG7284442.1 MerR family transcriptional regulator [Cellulomonas sp. ACRRI]